MADRLLEIRLIVLADAGILPEITLDDFIEDLRSEWRIEEMGAWWVLASTGQDRETTT